MTQTRKRTAKTIIQNSVKDNSLQEDFSTKTMGNQDKIILYGKLKTLMNIRKNSSLSAEIITTYKKNTFVEILEICDDWYKIKCPESDTGFAFVSNENGLFVFVGKEIYTVKLCETIFKIAKDKLGNSDFARKIVLANGMTSSTVKVGMRLLIP